MKKVLNLKNISICVGILMLIFTKKAQAYTGTVSTETLNLRSETSTSSSVLELLNDGDELEIISENGNWYKVKFKDKEGYVSKDYVTIKETSADIPNMPETNETSSTTTSTNISSQIDTTNNIKDNTVIKLEKDVTIKILPLINSNSLGTAKLGEEITVITSANNWIFIQTSDISGWIVKDESVGQTIQNTNKQDETQNSDNKVNNNDEENNNEPNDDNNEKTEDSGTDYSENKIKYINASSVYVRSEPSTSGDVVTTLIRNTDVTVTGEAGDWYKVKYNNYNGYIYKDLLSDSKIEETNRSNSRREQDLVNIENIQDEQIQNEEISYDNTSNKGNEIVEYAKKYLGCPYVYGGSGSTSFDCSGFTMYVYDNFGYSLSHSARAQSRVGKYVAKENLQPGDLVFFLDYETMDDIGHCGIYIGEGNFIHASSGSGYCVKISTLSSGSYYNRYATARRLI